MEGPHYHDFIWERPTDGQQYRSRLTHEHGQCGKRHTHTITMGHGPKWGTTAANVALPEVGDMLIDAANAIFADVLKAAEAKDPFGDMPIEEVEL